MNPSEMLKSDHPRNSYMAPQARKIWKIRLHSQEFSSRAQRERLFAPRIRIPWMRRPADSDSVDSRAWRFGFRRIPGPLDSDSGGFRDQWIRIPWIPGEQDSGSVDSWTCRFGFGILARSDIRLADLRSLPFRIHDAICVDGC